MIGRVCIRGKTENEIFAGCERDDDLCSRLGSGRKLIRTSQKKGLYVNY
jgi:hypothetical protein